MKKATVFAAALALALSLAACGNQDNAGSQTGSPAGMDGQTNNGAGENSGSLTDQDNGTGTDNQTRSWAGSTTGAGSNNTTRSWTGSGTDSNNTTGGTVGNDLRRAADGVGSAVKDAVDDGRDMLSRAASATTFERMLDNARVHDTDGVLTDGENSSW